VHVTVAGQHLKTLPSRLSTVDLARLRTDGARPAGPPPARSSPGLLAAGATVEIDRLVHSQGAVVLAGRQLPVGSPLAGRQVTLRLDPQLVHVIVDGKLWRTIAFTLPPTDRAMLRVLDQHDQVLTVVPRTSRKGGQSLQGLRAYPSRPGLESVTPPMKPNCPASDGPRHESP
jgi:hypothetical protein